MKKKMRRKLNTARITRCGMAAAAAVSLILVSVIPFPGELLAGEEPEGVRAEEESTEAEEAFGSDREESLSGEDFSGDGDALGEEEYADAEEASGEEWPAGKADAAGAREENGTEDGGGDGKDEEGGVDEADEPEEPLAENDTIKIGIEQNEDENSRDGFPYVLTVENKTDEDIDGIRIASDTDGLSFSYFCKDEDTEDDENAGEQSFSYAYKEDDADGEDGIDDAETFRQVFSKDAEDGELVFVKPLEAGEKIAVLLYAEYTEEETAEAYEGYGGYEDAAVVTVTYEGEEEPLKISIPADCIEEIAERQEEERTEEKLAENDLTEEEDARPQIIEESTDIEETSGKAEEPEEPDDLAEEPPAPTEEHPAPAPEAQQPDDNGIFSITLPTTFEIPMFSTNEGIEVMSEDVVLCNEGDFPVDVTVSRVEVSVKRRLPESTVRQTLMPMDGSVTHDLVEEAKQCDLSLRLLLDGQEARARPAPEGVTEDAEAFTLAAKQPGTDAERLMEDRFADRVDSPDCAVLNFRGTATDGTGFTWERGDLKAKIVFSFARHEEP